MDLVKLFWILIVGGIALAISGLFLGYQVSKSPEARQAFEERSSEFGDYAAISLLSVAAGFSLAGLCWLVALGVFVAHCLLRRDGGAAILSRAGVSFVVIGAVLALFFAYTNFGQKLAKPITDPGCFAKLVIIPSWILGAVFIITSR